MGIGAVGWIRIIPYKTRDHKPSARLSCGTWSWEFELLFNDSVLISSNVILIKTGNNYYLDRK
jgi:hypothetical protein